MKNKLHKRFFIGPMTKNVAACVMRANRKLNIFGFVPSRRQIETVELGGGYVNNWTTEEFSKACKGPTILRDHAGPGQGKEKDDGLQSIKADLKSGIIFIHIDPWKEVKNVDEAIIKTHDLMKFAVDNGNAFFEIGTESAIFPYTPTELHNFLEGVRKKSPNLFKRVVYGVVQSGTQVLASGNIGKFDEKISTEMCNIVHDFGLRAKEHNSDYLMLEDFELRANCGVDSFNIAPEFGVIETSCVLDILQDHPELKKEFIKLCYESKKWKKWVKKKPTQLDATKICGHYNFATQKFQSIKEATNDPEFDKKICSQINKKLSFLLDVNGKITKPFGVR